MFETTNNLYIYINIICYTTIIYTVASPDGGFPREQITQPSTGPSARYPPQGSTWRPVTRLGGAQLGKCGKNLLG